MIKFDELTIANNEQLAGKNVRIYKVFINKNSSKYPYTYIITYKTDEGYKSFKYFGSKSINSFITTCLEINDIKDVNNAFYEHPCWFNVTKEQHLFEDGKSYYSFEWNKLPDKK